MQAFVKALVESTHYVKTNPESALKILQRYTRLPDRELLKLSYDEYAQKLWPRLPAIAPDDIKLILEHLAQQILKPGKSNPQRSSTTIWSMTFSFRPCRAAL